jgi:hypothetical protein
MMRDRGKAKQFEIESHVELLIERTQKVNKVLDHMAWFCKSSHSSSINVVENAKWRSTILIHLLYMRSNYYNLYTYFKNTNFQDC